MIGVLLLDQYNRYLVEGNLPTRPVGDKHFLYGVTRGCKLSAKGQELLPRSIVSNHCSNYNTIEPIGIGIRECGSYSDILLINRTIDSTEPSEADKIFNLDKFIRIPGGEIWMKKSTLHMKLK